MRKKKISALLIAFQFGMLAGLRAHETWLAPSDFTAQPAVPIRFSLTSGMNFPTLEYAIRSERVASGRVRQNGKISDLIDPRSAKTSLQFRNTFFATGLVTAWLTLHPRALDLSEAKVAEYFEEISASREIRELWTSLKGKYKWRETYTKCTKTFVVIGEGRDDSSWKDPVGMPLEIVPLNDPTTWQRGEAVAVQLMQNGKPLPNAPLGLMGFAEGQRVFQETDADGRASFTLNHEGPALFFAVKLDWREPKWTSIFTTMCVEVRKPVTQ